MYNKSRDSLKALNYPCTFLVANFQQKPRVIVNNSNDSGECQRN